MSNINLKNCTKESLKKSIVAMENKAKTNTYILLEDIYTNNPSILYTTDYKRKSNAFGEINKNMNCIISYLEDKEGSEEKRETFIDNLYDYIVKEYR